MSQVVIDGVEYDVPVITYGVARVIKRFAGVRGAEISEALAAGDTDVLLAMAAFGKAHKAGGTAAEIAARAEEIAEELLGSGIEEIVWISGDEDDKPEDPTNAPTGNDVATTTGASTPSSKPGSTS